MSAKTSKVRGETLIKSVRSKSRFLTGTAGSEVAEAALVLPIAFMVLLGIYWFGRAFNVYATINHAAREGARYAVAQGCASSCNNVAPTVDKIALQVGQAMQASGLDPGLAVSDSVTHTACPVGTNSCAAYTGTPPIYYCNNVQLVASPPAGSGGPVCGVSIDFQYPFQLSLPFTSLNGQLVNLSAHVQMKTEQ